MASLRGAGSTITVHISLRLKVSTKQRVAPETTWWRWAQDDSFKTVYCTVRGFCSLAHAAYTTSIQDHVTAVSRRVAALTKLDYAAWAAHRNYTIEDAVASRYSSKVASSVSRLLSSKRKNSQLHT